MKAAAMVRLRDVSDLVTKGTTPTSLGRRFTSSGVNFLKVETFAADGSFIAGRQAFIDDSTHQLLRRSQLVQGDILFSIAGALGRSTVVEQAWLPANTNQAFAIIRPSTRGRSIHPRYLLWQLRSPAIARRIAEINVQAAQANLSLEQVRDFEIPFVSSPEQETIAAALDDADDLIATLERLITKKHAIKQGMMQQLLTGRTRLPGFNSEWSRITIGEVSEFLTGYPFVSASFAATGIRLIRGSNVKRGEIDWSPEIAMYWAKSDPGLRAFALRDGDIVVAMDGALVGRSFARITDAELPAYLVQRVARLRGKAVDQDLLYQWISSRGFAKHVDDVKTHTAIPHISPRDIRDFEISMPVDVDEQRAIAEVLGDADLQIGRLKSRVTKARAIKSGMMQQLLTGRTRLPVETA